MRKLAVNSLKIIKVLAEQWGACFIYDNNKLILNKTEIVAITRNKIIDLVFIDEGEGLVVDYLMEYNSDKLNEEENKDA